MGFPLDGTGPEGNTETVTNQERPEESLARVVVEQLAGLKLEHADHNGDVDYRFNVHGGGLGALEVTTVTDQKSKIARDQWDKAAPAKASAPSLKQCWQVWMHDRDVRYRGLPGRLEAAIKTLEDAGRQLDRGRFHDFWGSPATERGAARALINEKVIWAKPYPELCRAEAHDPPHRIDIVRETGGTASGSEAALVLIEAELADHPDNFAKLRGADEKHLFVWIDGDTDLAIARPFRGGQVADWEHFGLPTRPPELFEPLDRLWIIDRATLTGWIWAASAGWTAVPEPLELN